MSRWTERAQQVAAWLCFALLVLLVSLAVFLVTFAVGYRLGGWVFG